MGLVNYSCISLETYPLRNPYIVLEDDFGLLVHVKYQSDFPQSTYLFKYPIMTNIQISYKASFEYSIKIQTSRAANKFRTPKIDTLPWL